MTSEVILLSFVEIHLKKKKFENQRETDTWTESWTQKQSQIQTPALWYGMQRSQVESSLLTKCLPPKF